MAVNGVVDPRIAGHSGEKRRLALTKADVSSVGHLPEQTGTRGVLYPESTLMEARIGAGL